MDNQDIQLLGRNLCHTKCQDKNKIFHPETCIQNTLTDCNGNQTLFDWITADTDKNLQNSLLDWLELNYPISGGGECSCLIKSVDTNWFDVSDEGLLSFKDNPYELPVATDNILGGIKVGSGLTITNGVLKNPNVYTTTEDSGIIINESNEISIDSSIFPTINNGLLTISDANNTSVNFTANSSVNASFTIPKATSITYGTVKAVESTEGSNADVYPVKIGSSTTTYTNGTTISTGQLYFVAPPSTSNVYTAGEGIHINNANEINFVPRNPVYFIKDPIDDWGTSTNLFDFTTKLFDDLSWGLHPIIYLYISNHGDFSTNDYSLGSHLQGFIKLLTTDISTSLPEYSSFPDNIKGMLTLYVYTSCTSELYPKSTITFDKNYCFLQGLSVGTTDTNASVIRNSYSHNNPSIAFSNIGGNARTLTEDGYTIVLNTTGKSVNKFDFLYLSDSASIKDSITRSAFNIVNPDFSDKNIKIHIFWSSYEAIPGAARTDVATNN